MGDGGQSPYRNGAKNGERTDAALLRLIVDSATDFAIFTMDPNGIVTSWNGGAEHLLGYGHDEIVGLSADVVFPPEEGGAAAAAEERRQALALGRAEDERWHARQDGSRFWASGLLMPLTDRTQGFVKILRDRSDQHAADMRLRESEELFRVLATNIPQLVFRSRDGGRRSWGSPQWSIFTGLALPESLDFGWLDAMHPDDRDGAVAAWADAEPAGGYYHEHRYRRSVDGEYRWHQTRAAPLQERSSAMTEWVGSSTDIHELRALKDRQQVLVAELQHRTRNLLAVVQSVARQTLRSAASLAEFGKEFEGRLRALSRVQGLLARVDGDVDVRALVEAELTAHNGRERNEVIVAGPTAALPAGSAQTLALALHELATNALKYGALRQPEAGLAVSWTVEDEGGQRWIVLDWVESGVAMPDPATPQRKGYGCELIERALPYSLKAKTALAFGPDGVHCRIATPAAREHRERRP